MSKVVRSGGYRCSYKSHKNTNDYYDHYTGIRVAHTWIPGKSSVRGAVWVQKTGEQYLGRRFSYYPHLWSSYRGFRLACTPHHPRRFVVRGGCWLGNSMYLRSCYRRSFSERRPYLVTVCFRLACEVE